MSDPFFDPYMQESTEGYNALYPLDAALGLATIFGGAPGLFARGALRSAAPQVIPANMNRQVIVHPVQKLMDSAHRVQQQGQKLSNLVGGPVGSPQLNNLTQSIRASGERFFGNPQNTFKIGLKK